MKPIKVPEAGDDSIALATIRDLESLQESFGPQWYQQTLISLENNDLSTIKACARIIIKGGNFDALFADAPLEKIGHYCLDALAMAVHGLTFDALAERMEEQMIKRAARDARMATAVEAASRAAD